MAGDLLDRAEEITLSRVATPEGQKKYGEQIGQEIVKDGPKAKKNPITIEHLISLKGLLDQAKATGDEAAIAAANKNMKDAIGRFSQGKSFAEINAVLKKLEPAPTKG